MKKIIALLLAVLLAFGCTNFVFAEEPAEESGSFTLMNFNVDGLPVPKFLSNSGRDPLADSKKIAEKIHAINPDVLAVQEDFNFHQTIKKGVDADYTTYHNGGVPWGDGLNFYSRFPIYNVHREAWKEACGVFTNGSDQLTPKGFICTSFKMGEGVYLDIYDIHADAYGGEDNTKARLAEYEQLLSYVNTYSKGHATIITGDFNSYFSEKQNQLYDKFIEREGFKEAWIEVNYQNNYETGVLPHPDYHKPEWSDGGKWGVWDSAEKMFYRNGDGITLQATANDYVRIEDEDHRSLSDHSAQIGTFQFTVDRTTLNDTRTYKKPIWNPIYLFFHHIYFVFKALYLVGTEIPKVISGEIKVKIDK